MAGDHRDGRSADKSLNSMLIILSISFESAQLLTQELTVSEILREYGKKFIQIQKMYSDGQNGRCAIGVIMSFHGWNRLDEPGSAKKVVSRIQQIEI